MTFASKTNNASRFPTAPGGVFLAALFLALLSVLTGSSVAGGEGVPLKTVVPSPSKPWRIISICLQGDQFLLQFVARERIVALSALATDPDVSAHWEAARGIPVTHGGAEELIRLKPDLVLVSSNSTPLTVTMLKQLGVRVLELGIPTDFDELRDQVMLVGRSLGEDAHAEEIVRSMDARLERLKARRPAPALRPTALFYFQDQFTPGAHTFANAILEAAGFRNLAALSTAGFGFSASAESIIMARPQYLILTRFREANPTLTQVSEAQPLFRKLEARTKVIRVSFQQLAEPDLSNLDLAEMLQARLRQ
jgi:iron complex transport system substrate-binding protein